MTLFEGLVIGHIVAGGVALVSFWIPVAARKGGPLHRQWGRMFVLAIYAAAAAAIGMAVLNLTLEKSRWPELADRDLFAGLFGWMMLFLALLSVGLVRHGLRAAAGVRRGTVVHPGDILLQVIVGLSAINCAAHGVRLAQPLMIVIALVGLIAAVTFLSAQLRPPASPNGQVREHLKAMVGAGISAYTAFLSVGLLRVMPAHVFNPLIWALPSIVGLAIIAVQLRRYRTSGLVRTPAG